MRPPRTHRTTEDSQEHPQEEEVVGAPASPLELIDRSVQDAELIIFRLEASGIPDDKLLHGNVDLADFLNQRHGVVADNHIHRAGQGGGPQGCQKIAEL